VRTTAHVRPVALHAHTRLKRNHKRPELSQVGVRQHLCRSAGGEGVIEEPECLARAEEGGDSRSRCAALHLGRVWDEVETEREERRERCAWCLVLGGGSQWRGAETKTRRRRRCGCGYGGTGLGTEKAGSNRVLPFTVLVRRASSALAPTPAPLLLSFLWERGR
jgi:hypothetical protein